VRYYLLSKVSFPLSLNLDSMDSAGNLKSLHIGARKEVEVSEEDLQSRELQKMLDKGYLFLKKMQSVAPMSQRISLTGADA